MEKVKLYALMFLIGAIAFTSCKDEDEDEPQDQQPQQFVANDDTFANFDTWTLETTHQGPDAALGAAHAGNDSTAQREVYFKDGQDPGSDGLYPKGTVIVKEVSNPSSGILGVTAMVKRGADFNPAGNDWEWFMLNADGTIMIDNDTGDPVRGANLGQCLNCHSQASDSDYVFSK